MNAQSLLDALMQANPAGATQTRINHATGPQGLAGAGSPLAGILGGLAETAGGLFNVGRERVQRGDPAAIGGLGALAGLVLGGRGGALGGGALALLGSLAYSALKKAGGEAGPVPPEQLAREAPLGLRPAAESGRGRGGGEYRAADHRRDGQRRQGRWRDRWRRDEPADGQGQ